MMIEVLLSRAIRTNKHSHVRPIKVAIARVCVKMHSINVANQSYEKSKIRISASGVEKANHDSMCPKRFNFIEDVPDVRTFVQNA